MKQLLQTGLCLVALFLTSSSSAFAATDISASFINVKGQYTQSQPIDIKVKLQNNSNAKRKLIVTYNVFYPQKTSFGPIVPIEIEIDALQSKEISILKGTIDSTYTNTQYTINVSVYENKLPILQAEQKFSVSVPSTSLPMEFSVKTCADEACLDAKKVFSVGESVFIKTESGIAGINYDIKISQPDETTVNYAQSIPFFPSQIGLYKLKIGGSKAGYTNFELLDNFSVNEKNIVAVSENTCVLNNVCDTNETQQNCPQDCVLAPTQFTSNIIIVAFIVLFTVFIARLLFYLKTRKTQSTN